MHAIVETEIEVIGNPSGLKAPSETIGYVYSDIVGVYGSFTEACEALISLKEKKLASGHWDTVLKESSKSVRLSNGGSYLKELSIITL